MSGLGSGGGSRDKDSVRLVLPNAASQQPPIRPRQSSGAVPQSPRGPRRLNCTELLLDTQVRLAQLQLFHKWDTNEDNFLTAAEVGLALSLVLVYLLCFLLG